MNTARTFNDAPATRGNVPLLVGLAGPSGGGKTRSALELATGMQRVTGGDIFFIDTESGRGRHYADAFKYRYVPFAAPFSPLDYLAAIEHCKAKGAGVVIVDSMSHEHEGPGGVVEWHDSIVEKMAGDDYKKRERCSMVAWVKPKQARRRLLNSLVQMNLNVILCFRANEKIKPVKGGEPEKLGFMPIAGVEFVYEMTCCALLPPCAGGVPQWRSEQPGEKMMIKLPEQFKPIFANPRPFDKAHGEAMAQWAKGGDASPEFTRLSKAIKDAASSAALEAVLPDLQKATKGTAIKNFEAESLRSLYGAQRDTLKSQKPVVTANESTSLTDRLATTADEYAALGHKVGDLLSRENLLWEDIESDSAKAIAFLKVLEGELAKVRS